MMELHMEIFDRLNEILWFRNCGKHSPELQLPFQFHWCEALDKASRSYHSNEWDDARTQAQGELTAYLAKCDYDLYGTSWNKLAIASNAILKDSVLPAMGKAALEILGNHIPINGKFALHYDVLSIAMFYTYKARFLKLPDFFEKTLLIFENGLLPCGWNGSFDNWPRGSLIVF